MAASAKQILEDILDGKINNYLSFEQGRREIRELIRLGWLDATYTLTQSGLEVVGSNKEV